MKLKKRITTKGVTTFNNKIIHSQNIKGTKPSIKIRDIKHGDVKRLVNTTL